VVALLVALLAVTSFLFAGAPRLFNLIADAALVHELQLAPAVDRDFELSSISMPPSATDPLASVDEVGNGYLAGFPDSVRRLIAQRRFSITTPRFEISDPPAYTTFVALRYQDGLESAIRIVSGRLPAATGQPLPTARAAVDQPPLGPGPPPTVEIAVSEATAKEIGVSVGFTITGTPDATDPSLRGVVTRRVAVAFKVVGIFSITDPTAEIWFGDHELQRPDIGGSEEFPIAYATGLVAAGSYADLTTAELPFRFAWRYFIDPERTDIAQIETLQNDLKQMQSRNEEEVFGPGIPGTLGLRTGLQRVIGQYLSERSVTEAVLTVAAIGPFVLAAGAIGMIAILLVLRRRAALELARGRGASGLLILGAQAWEAGLLAGGAALIGLLLATLLVPGRESPLSPPLAVATALGAVIALLAATWPAAWRRLVGARRDDASVLRTSPRRLVLELTAVGVAVAGVLILRQRGLVIGNRHAGEIVRLDPLLAAVPALAGLAVGLIAMRLYPLPIRILGWLAARRRDLVPVLGMRSVGRHAASANLPLLVLMLTAAFGTFASVLLSSIDHGQVDVARAQVGADYRIELAGGAHDPGIDPRSVAGVEAVAGAYVDQAATFADSPSQYSLVVLEATNADAYLAVTAGSSNAVGWPKGFSDLPAERGGAIGTPDGSPIPAIVSQHLPPGSAPLTLGDTFTVRVSGRDLTCVVVQERTSFPGVRAGAAFVIMSLPVLQEARGGPPLATSVLFVRGSEGAGPGLQALVRNGSPSSTVISRFERYVELRSAPLVAMLTGGFTIALLMAVLYAALAIVAALALTAARRRQDLAFLRTLGLSSPQALGLTVLEHGPPVLLALVPGVGLGIWIASLLAPGLGLEIFIGPDSVFVLRVAWEEIALIGATLALTVTIGVAATIWLAPRAQAVDALRLGGE